MAPIDIRELYEQEKKVAEHYASIGRVMRRTWKLTEMDACLKGIIEEISEQFDWHINAIVVKRDAQLYLPFYHANGHIRESARSVRIDEFAHSSDAVLDVLRTHEACRSSGRLVTFPQLNPLCDSFQFLAYPLINRDVLLGVLLLGRIGGEFDDCEQDIFRDLSEHITLAMDNISMYEEKQRYKIAAERSRLAKDLHDSVNQKLFSISLTAQGLADAIQHGNDPVKAELAGIGRLAQECLSEMKSLIWDLRMNEESKTVTTRIHEYARTIGLNVQVQMDSRAVLDGLTEEVFWRIAQEALNNVRKHAQTDEAAVRIKAQEGGIGGIHMHIIDHGCGFERNDRTSPDSFGLMSMQERIREIGGTIQIHSVKGKGTSIHVIAPVSIRTGKASDERQGASR